ncbi:MAG: ABC transporter substrate-binding protein [Anaerolineae bacterium]|nr:ABC transporter substrate-binding protein [Anaerolineae bacterium]
MEEKRLSRREFLRLSALAAAGAALAGCAPQTPAAKPTEVVSTAPPTEPTPFLFWFQAENHEPEYRTRVEELNEKFNIKFSYELMSRDAMTQKFPATLMAGSGFPDIIEQNADDIVKFLKGDDSVIPFVDLKPALKASPYADQVLMSRFDRYSKDGKFYGAPHDVHPVLMLYHERAWQEYGYDPSTFTTYEKFLQAAKGVAAKTNMEMPDGRPLGVIMDCLSCTNLPARMMDLGIWWTDADGNPMLKTPEFREAASNWMLFRDYWMNIDWGNQVAMLKEGQVLTQFCPDWLYGIHFQGTANDKEWLANSPMRMAILPGMKEDAPRTTSWGGTSASVPKLSPIKELAVEVLLYLYFENGEGQLAKRFVDTGILPPVPGCWDDPVFHEPKEYLGGQIAGELFIEAAKRLPSYSEQWTTHLVTEAWGGQFASAWAGEITLDEAIEAAYAQAVADIEKNKF